MSKILKKINLVIGAIRPKNVTWSLNEDGTGYEIVADDTSGKLGTNQQYASIASVKKEKEDIFEQFLTESGIPWIQPKVETHDKHGNNIEGIESPKIPNDALKFLDQTNLETKRSMQKSIDLKTSLIKNTAKKSKNKGFRYRYCRYTKAELDREKQVDIETRRRLKEMIDLKSKFGTDTKHAGSTNGELPLEKQADFESRKRLREGIIEHHKKEKVKLDEEIQFQKNQAELQKKSTIEIKQKKIELKEAKEEKDRIVNQMKEKQKLIYAELETEKQNLEKARSEKDRIVKQNLEEIKSEKNKIINEMKEKQKLIFAELEKEKQNLEKAKTDYEKIEKQSELEKTRLDEQINIHQKQTELQEKSSVQIAQKKIELENARKERDQVVELIREKQSLISEDLKRERLYLDKAKTEYEKIEKQSELEKTRLDEQIQFQQKQAKLQAKSTRKIEEKKIELEEARSENEKIVKQIQEKQSLISKDIKQEKQHLEKVKEERKNIEKQAKLEQNFVAEKISKELEKIENQANLIQKIEKEQKNLQSFIQKKQKMMEIVKQEKTKLAEEKIIKKHADTESRRIADELLEDKFKAEQEKEIVKFFDPKKDAQYYLDKYDNEPYFKELFDTKFPDFTIEDAIGLVIPKESLTIESQSFEAEVFDPNKELQYYVDMYNNEPSYKEWFDKKFPGQTIQEIIGMPEPKETEKKIDTNLPKISKMFQYQYF